MLQEVIGNNIDVLLISETELDASFFSSQLILDGFTASYRPTQKATRRRYNAFYKRGHTFQSFKG